MSRPLAIAKALSIPSFVVFDADTDKRNITEQERDNRCILRLCGLENTNPMPSEILWEYGVVVWPTRIADVIREEMGSDAWETKISQARELYGFSQEVNAKNPLLISAIIDLFDEDGIRSEILDKLLDEIYLFAESG